MSYRAFLNGQLIDISDIKPIAYTKQVNDLARLDTRQSNFTHKVTLSKDSQRNVDVLEQLGQLGNQSNAPYRRLRFDLVDANTSKHLIYNGWAVISQTSNGYELNTYDGIIDFYRTIENKNLTDCGISELNHLKNLTNIVNSWDDTYNYKYILADYNGKVYTTDNKLNADFLVPSAKISYLWNKVHEYAGYTFIGSTFNTEKFINHYMTFPKPVPTEEPVLIFQTSQTSVLTVQNPSSIFPFMLDVFPNDFTTAYATNVGQNVGAVSILQSGSYLFNSTGAISQIGVGEITELGYQSIDAIGNVIQEGLFNPQINQNVIVACEAGGTLMIVHYGLFSGFANPINGTLTTSLNLIEGYTANFEEALIDFSIKDFVNEVMQHYGLTAFKDKYTKHIEYLTLEEILQAEVPPENDWSDKFSERTNEKYIFGNYGKKNSYRYRYNKENEMHNDGYLYIDNENLKDEVPILKSKIYSPELRKTTVLTNQSNVYPLWEKNIKDNNEIEYKDLTGRFYYMRYQTHNFGITQHLKSEVLNTSTTFTIAPIESYWRLPLQQVLFDNYSTLESILYKSKTLEASFYLSVSDVEEFDFKKLIFVKQLGGYFLVNKIVNFVPNVKTKCELIKVDYFRENEMPEPVEYYLIIDTVTVDGCEVTFDVTTNIEQSTTVQIVAYALTPDGLGGFYYAPIATVDSVVMNSNQVVHTFDNLPPVFLGGYKFKLIHTSSLYIVTESEITDVQTVSGACYTPPPADLTYINITNVETLSVSGGIRTVEVTYESDLDVATMTLELVATGGLTTVSQTYYLQSQNGTVTIELAHAFYGTNYNYNITLSSLGVTSNTANSNE